MSLPYSDSEANPLQAQARIRKMLLKFGVSRLRFDEDIEKGEIKVEFIYKEFPVSLPVNIHRLAERYLEDDPWTPRRRSSRSEWATKKKEVAQNAAFSLLEDFLKGLLMAVELGVFSFEEIFLSYFRDAQGRRLGEVIVKQLPHIISGRLALPEGE